MKKLKEQALALGDKARETALRGKIGETQLNLQNIRKKDKAMKDLQKTVSSQQDKIKNMDLELKKIKDQRVDVIRRRKEDQQKYDRLRIQKMKELAQSKLQIKVQQFQNRKLKADVQKTHGQLQRRAQQINRLKASLNMFKSLFKTRGGRCDNSLTQTLQEIVTRMVLDQERLSNLEHWQSELSTLQLSHFQELQKFNVNRIKLQQQQSSQDLLIESQELKLEIRQGQQLIQTMRQSIQFLKEKCKNYASEGCKFNPEQQLMMQLQKYNLKEVRQAACILLGKLCNVVEQFFIFKKSNDLVSKRQRQLEELVQSFQKQNQHDRQQFMGEIQRLRQQAFIKHEVNEEDRPKLIAPQAINVATSNKAYERRIHQLKRALKHSQLGMQQLKRKCDVVQQKYDSIKRANGKDKFIGITQIEMRNPTNNNNNVIHNHAQQNQVLRKNNHSQLLKQRGTSDSVVFNTPFHLKSQKQQCIQIDFDQEDQREQSGHRRWQPAIRVQAHANPILALQNFNGNLLSCASKSIRQWDITRLEMICDRTNHPALQGFVKQVKHIPALGVFAALCDKTVSIWDVRILQPVATLRKFSDQVRALHEIDHVLITGGKGNSTSGSIQFWDIRTQTCIEDREKTQDVFSFAHQNRILYFGSRSHHVHRIRLDSKQPLPALQPPHFDTVSALAALDSQVLVSGSWDKSVKIWRGNTLLASSCMSTGWVNTVVASQNFSKTFYAGCKDGLLKVCKLRNSNKVTVVGSIQTSPYPLQGLAELQAGYIASASADHFIKLWKPSPQALEYLFTSVDD